MRKHGEVGKALGNRLWTGRKGVGRKRNRARRKTELSRHRGSTWERSAQGSVDMMMRYLAKWPVKRRRLEQSDCVTAVCHWQRSPSAASNENVETMKTQISQNAKSFAILFLEHNL